MLIPLSATPDVTRLNIGSNSIRSGIDHQDAIHQSKSEGCGSGISSGVDIEVAHRRTGSGVDAVE